MAKLVEYSKRYDIAWIQKKSSQGGQTAADETAKKIQFVADRSCWRWRLGPKVPGVGRWFSRKGTCGGADGVSISQAHKVRASGRDCSLARLNDPPTVR